MTLLSMSFRSLVDRAPARCSGSILGPVGDLRSCHVDQFTFQKLVIITGIVHVPSFMQVNWQNRESSRLRSRHHQTILFLPKIN